MLSTGARSTKSACVQFLVRAYKPSAVYELDGREKTLASSEQAFGH